MVAKATAKGISLNGRVIPLEGDPEEVIYSWAFPSESDPSRDPYNLTLQRCGVVFCYCPRWRFKLPDQPRSCKHFLRIEREINEIRQLFKTGQPLPVYAAPAPSAKAQKVAKYQAADLDVGITLRTRRMISIE